MIKFRYLSTIVLLAVLVIYLGGCEFKEPPEPPAPLALSIELYGPAEGEEIPVGGYVTFRWKAMGGAGNYEYTYQLVGVDPSPITTYDHQVTYWDLVTPGDYTFTVTVTDEEQKTATAERHFKVGPNTPPEVTISPPRQNPKYTPGADVYFTWTATDPDKFGKVVGYRWAKTAADTTNYTAWAPATAATFSAPTEVGSYTFYLQAKDNSGAITTATVNYEVKEATILLIDDVVSPSTIAEIEYDKFYRTVFDGFPYAEWDVETQGVPTYDDLAPYNVVVWYGTDSGAWWYHVGKPYHEEGTCFLSEYLDAGGKLWAIGDNILEWVWYTSNPPPPEDFEAKYLHVSTDTTKPWVAGQELNSIATTTGDPDHFPFLAYDIAVVPGAVYHVDAFWPEEGVAEAIYEGFDTLAKSIGYVAIRYPIGGTDTEVVFQTAPLYGFAPEGVRTLVQQIVGTEMGE